MSDISPKNPKDPLQTSRDLLNDHLNYIEIQCMQAVRRLAKGSEGLTEVDRENESLELFNRVIDRIQAKDFDFVRRFDGRSRFSTYLTTLIARQAVDMIRQRKGRSRARERAQSLGKVGLSLFEKLCSQGLKIPEALRAMQHENAYDVTEQRLFEMALRIVGQGGAPQPIVLSPETLSRCPDSTMASPESIALERERQGKLVQAAALLRNHLKGTDRLLLRLRFPPDDHSPTLKAVEIADLLHISPKAVYRRLDRLLPRCRLLLEKAGINAADLLPPRKGNSSSEIRHNQGSVMP